MAPGELARTTDLEHASLIVVDVQNDFCDPDELTRRGLILPATATAVDRILAVIGAARARGVKVIYTQHWLSDETASPVWAETMERISVPLRTAWAGTWGADFYKVAPLPGEAVVRKHRHSAFFGTNLQSILRISRIETVVVVGFVTDGCVACTARDAFMRDFHVVVLGDCCNTVSRKAHDATLRNIDTYFGVVANSEDVVAAWLK